MTRGKTKTVMGRQHWEDLLVAAEYKRVVWSSKGTKIFGGELLTGVRHDAGCRAIREKEENDDDDGGGGDDDNDGGDSNKFYETESDCTVGYFLYCNCMNTRKLLVAMND